MRDRLRSNPLRDRAPSKYTVIVSDRAGRAGVLSLETVF
ncbi:hypothetical protein CKA32_002562 [Geitlerinema sp. FC II]|nr:hypothetical protein CKA32_002562 [Geitlerinema sp. FC II]